MLASHFKKKKKTRMISPTVSGSTTLVSSLSLSSSSSSPKKKNSSPPVPILIPNVGIRADEILSAKFEAAATRKDEIRSSENYPTVLQKYKSDIPTIANANSSFSFGFEVEVEVEVEVEETPISLPNSSKTRRRRKRRKKQQKDRKREINLPTAEFQKQSSLPNDDQENLDMEAIHSFAQSVEPLITQNSTQHCQEYLFDGGDGLIVNESHGRKSSACILNHTRVSNPMCSNQESTNEIYKHSGVHHMNSPSVGEPTGIQNSAETNTQLSTITPLTPRNVISKVDVSTAGTDITSSNVTQQTPHKKGNPKQAKRTSARVRQRRCKQVAKKKGPNIIQFNPSDKGKAMVNRNSLAAHREKNRMMTIPPQDEARAIANNQADNGRDLLSPETDSESNAFTFGFNFDSLLSGVP